MIRISSENCENVSGWLGVMKGDPLQSALSWRVISKGRRAQKEAAGSGKRCTTVFPDMQDHEAVQRFFLQEIQLGEELLAAGETDNGVEHLGNAVAVCGQPNDLLQVLQQTLQPRVFHMLIKRLPVIAPRLMKAQHGNEDLLEDDVE